MRALRDPQVTNFLGVHSWHELPIESAIDQVHLEDLLPGEEAENLH
jgi:hypothetical protein